MNTQLLKDSIRDRGMVTKFIYEKLGLSHNGFYKKMNGEIRFTDKEVEDIGEMLRLTDQEKEGIFK